MLRIRLRRVGAKKQPIYRIVVAENEWPRDGRFLEVVGQYNPLTDPATIEVNEGRISPYLGDGAAATDSVKQLLGKIGTLDRYARLQQGEALDALLTEAAAAAEAAKAATPRRTKSDTFVPSKKNRAKKTEAAAA